MLSELPPGGHDPGHGEAGRHDQKDHRRGPWSPVVGGSEAAVEAMTRVASSAERPANTSATRATPVQTPKETPAGVNGP
jgi:hypothetical protein